MSLRVCEVRDFREAEVAVPMGKVGSVSLLMCHKMCSCCFARQAWHFLIFHMCEVRDLCEAKVAVPMGKVAKIRLRGLRRRGIEKSGCVVSGGGAAWSLDPDTCGQ